MKILRNIDLGNKTTIWVWSTASFFSEIKTKEDLLEVYNFAKENNLWFLALWLWSNVFFYNDIKDKIVLQLRNRFIEKLDWDLFCVWAWVNLWNLILSLAKKWFDLSNLSWYPSTIWWAICVNSGLMWKDIWDYLISANIFNFKTWKFETWTKKDFNFSYRYSKLKWKDWYLLFDCMLCVPSWNNLLNKVNEIIKKRVWVQPKWRCGWCFFKNPDWDFAWRLIEQAWLKWFNIWGAYVSEIHANFLMTKTWAKKEDLFKLKEYVIAKIQEKYNIKLEPELVIY